MRAVIEAGGVVGQHQVEIGDVNMRLVPVDQRDPICGHADVARVGVAMDDAGLTSDEPRPRGSASSNGLRRHCAEVDLRPGLGVQEVGRRSPGRTLRPALRQPMQPAEQATCLHPTARAPPILLTTSRPLLVGLADKRHSGECQLLALKCTCWIYSSSSHSSGKRLGFD
jgi:hypothetical protein